MNTTKNSFDLYLKDLGRFPRLQPDEVIELSQKARSGDKAARKKLINANLRLVIAVAKKYQNNGLLLEDLVASGNFGLMVAVDRFDSTRGVPFAAYAQYWINQSIRKALSETSRAIRLPNNRVLELGRIKKARNMLRDTMSESQEIREIALMLDMSPKLVRELLDVSRETVSLDTPVNNQGDWDGVSTLGDRIEDEAYPLPEEEVNNMLMKEDILCALKTLEPREEKILRLYFGFDGGEKMSLNQIAGLFNVSKESIRQIKNRALKRLGQLPQLQAYAARGEADAVRCHRRGRKVLGARALSVWTRRPLSSGSGWSPDAAS